MEPVKLTWEKVDKIRELHKQGRGGYKSLSKMFSVSASTIRSIIKENSWPPEKDFRDPIVGARYYMNLEKHFIPEDWQ